MPDLEPVRMSVLDEQLLGPSEQDLPNGIVALSSLSPIASPHH